jgi:hypothetical protein
MLTNAYINFRRRQIQGNCGRETALPKVDQGQKTPLYEKIIAKA